MDDDDIPVTSDDEREVPLEDEAEFDPPPATLDPDERIEVEDELDEFEAGFEG
ncbi:hypothetical protein [Microbacterium elymi]|uniref:Uncharacterized protein n=1 Tax=Microbacterium elymi TaxID=2909587 RepID=A0ABY5NIY9_9MICO|nr:MULTISPECIES: hypothetical protein [Microbacterium]UUT35084.1 hypothetical protein L2X98_32920 [Microbacterium elymi]